MFQDRDHYSKGAEEMAMFGWTSIRAQIKFDCLQSWTVMAQMRTQRILQIECLFRTMFLVPQESTLNSNKTVDPSVCLGPHAVSKRLVL